MKKITFILACTLMLCSCVQKPKLGTSYMQVGDWASETALVTIAVLLACIFVAVCVGFYKVNGNIKRIARNGRVAEGKSETDTSETHDAGHDCVRKSDGAKLTVTYAEGDVAEAKDETGFVHAYRRDEIQFESSAVGNEKESQNESHAMNSEEAKDLLWPVAIFIVVIIAVTWMLAVTK